jgi:hypothetical protein
LTFRSHMSELAWNGRRRVCRPTVYGVPGDPTKLF